MNAHALIGRAIAGRYQLQRCIAESPAAFVYEARDLLLQSRVAAKVLPPGDLDTEQIERFRREAMVTSQLRHPYALKVFDQGELEDGSLWLVMEFLEGETLECLLKRAGALSPERLREIFGPLCEVLSEAHQRGVIHRDLHPGNIMLVPMGQRVLAKILDFGLAGLSAAPRLTAPSEISGTPSYMAPEQWLGLSKADEKSDIYSLGVIAYQCLSGRLPLDADSPVAWLKAHRKELPRDLWESMERRPLPLSLYEAVMSAIAHNPEQRPASVVALWEMLSREDISMTEPSLPAPPVEERPSAKEDKNAAASPPFALWIAVSFSALALLCSGLVLGLWWRAHLAPAPLGAASSPQGRESTKQGVTSPPTTSHPSPASAPEVSPVLAVSRPAVSPKKVVRPQTAPTQTTPQPPTSPPPATQEGDIAEITKNPWQKKP